MLESCMLCVHTPLLLSLVYVPCMSKGSPVGKGGKELKQ